MRRKKGRKSKQASLSTNSSAVDAQKNENLSRKRKRNSNFTKDEVKCLVIEYGKRSNDLNFGTRAQKQKKWNEIATHLNNLHPHFVRTVDEVKTKWFHLCTPRKKKRRCGNVSQSSSSIKDDDVPDEDEHYDTKTEADLLFRNFDFVQPVVNKKDNDPYILKMKIEHDGDNETSHSKGGPSINASKESKSTSHHPEIINGIFLPASASGRTNCSNDISPDILNLKQESINIRKCRVQIEEERRSEEKQKWWEEKLMMQLQRQKLELEIRQLQSSV